MEYTQLLKTAWRATWRHKKMWWLGMAILSGGTTGLIRATLNIGSGLVDDSSGPVAEASHSPLAELWWQEYWWMIFIVIGCVVLLWLVAIIFHLIAQSGLYFGAQQARLQQPVQFSEMLQAGVKSFWRYVGFYLLLALGKFFAQVGIVLNILLLAASIIGLIIAVPLSLLLLFLSWPLALALEVFVIYSLQEMTLQHVDSVTAMRHAWQRWQRFPWQSALSLILMVLIELIVWLLVILVMLLVATPFAIFAYVAYTSQVLWLAILSGSAGVIVLLAMGLIAKGIFVSFQSHYWNRVYALPQ